MKRFLKNKKAFSLLELLTVISILLIISAVSIPKYQSYKRQSQMNAIKPTLSYIYNLFKLHYEEKRTFKSLKISNISLVKNYCIIVRINAVKIKYQPSPNLFGNCAKISSDRYYRPNSQTESFRVFSPKSGFVIIAYGETEEMDVGMNHNGDIIQGSNLFTELTKGLKECADYTNRTSCQTAGCYYNFITKNCDNSP